jgi:hypothetical protein
MTVQVAIPGPAVKPVQGWLHVGREVVWVRRGLGYTSCFYTCCVIVLKRDDDLQFVLHSTFVTFPITSSFPLHIHKLWSCLGVLTKLLRLNVEGRKRGEKGLDYGGKEGKEEVNSIIKGTLNG